MAAEKGDMDSLKRIRASEPASLQMQDPRGWLPLHYAVSAGHLKAVHFLFMNGADINHITRTGISALAVARQSLGHDHAVTKFLLAVGAVTPNQEL